MAKSPSGNELWALYPASIFPASRTFKSDFPDPPGFLIWLVRALALLALPLLVPTSLQAQGDTSFVAWLRFRDAPPLTLSAPAILRSPWASGPRLSPAMVGRAWDSTVAQRLDSNRVARVTAWRLRRIYGQRAFATEDSTTGERPGPIGLSRRYADLNIDGTARMEVRTERLKNLRCTPSEFLDPNSGCNGGFKAPRLDTYLAIRSGGVIGRRLHVDVDYDSERDFTARNDIRLYYEGLEDEVVRRVELGTVTFRPPASRFLTASIPANNFGVNAAIEVGPVQMTGIAATQKGSVIAERTYTVGSTTAQPQDREARDLDFEARRFFWVVDPTTLPGFPTLDILQLDPALFPPSALLDPANVQVYRSRAASSSGLDPNLGGITAVAISADTTQQARALWQLLRRGIDYYGDPSGVWFALAAPLDRSEFLAVSYKSPVGAVGTFPSQDTPVLPDQAPRDTLRLIVQPDVDSTRITFRHEMRQIYRVAGSDLDLGSVKVEVTLNRSSRPQRSGAQGTYLAELGLATAADPNTFDLQNRLFPRNRDPGASAAIPEYYIVFPSARPFADATHLLPQERNDALYSTPVHLLFSEGPSAKFIVRLSYNASSTADRTSLSLGAFQLHQGSEVLFLNGRRLERGVDYNIDYDLGQVTFLDPNGLFGAGGGTIQARFEERGVFAVAPTEVYGLATRLRIGEAGGVNLVGVYQVEKSAYNRPQLGFEAQAHLVGGVGTDLHFRTPGVTGLLNHLTSTPATAPSKLDLTAEVALTRPDPSRSGQAYLESFESDQGIPVSLRESRWQFGSRPRSANGVDDIIPVFDTADAVQVTWQNLVVGRGGVVPEIRARDIDPNLEVVGGQDQLETVWWGAVLPDTAGGQVRQDNSYAWVLPTRPNQPRWRSVATGLSTTGLDLSKNEYLEFWVLHDSLRTSEQAGVRIVVDLGRMSEEAIALGPESLTVAGADSVFTGKQYLGLGRLDTERQTTGVFNAATDDIGILGDRPDALVVNGQPVSAPALCQRQLSNDVPVYPWGDPGARCSNGNGALDTEDQDGDNVLDGQGGGEDALRWVVDLRGSPYFVRDGVQNPDGSGWKLYRVPLRTPAFKLGTPNIRLVKQLRLTLVAEPDQGGPDLKAFFALARMRFLGAPWVRRSDSPVFGLDSATGAPVGEVVASTISTEDNGYTSPPGVVGELDKNSGGGGNTGTVVNERSLRVVARQIVIGQRAEAYLRFPNGPQNLLRYRELRAWVRGVGPGWDNRDFEAYVRVGSDSRNFYTFQTRAQTTTWVPEIRVNLEQWRALRSQIESRWLQGLKADSAARVACGGDTLSIAYVVCDGPYLAYVEDPAISPPNLARVQELSAGILRVGSTDPTTDAELWVDDIRLVDPISQVGSAMALDAHLIASDVADVSASFVRQDGHFQQIGAEPTYRTTGAFQLAAGVRADRFLPAAFGLAVPMQLSYIRTTEDPELLNGTDVEAAGLSGLRKPTSYAWSYSTSIRRARRGGTWLAQGLMDPLTLSAAFTRAQSVTDLSQATSNSRQLVANYGLQPGRGGFTLNLGSLVDHLPGFLRKTDAANGLRKSFVNLAPTSVRLASGFNRSQSDLLAFLVPVQRASDSLLQPVASLQHTWRNAAGITLQPLGMLSLSGDLASTRDLRHYADSTSIGRLAELSRMQLLGLDVGVERDRQLSSSMTLAPRFTSWLRPHFATTSAFLLLRSLTGRSPIQVDGDTAGAFLLPQTLNNSRSNEIGAVVEAGRLAARLAGDSSGAGRVLRQLRPFSVTDRLTRGSTFDLATFDPSLGYQLGFGGLESFLYRGEDSAIVASEVRNTTMSGGADLPFGLGISASYTRTRASRFQLTKDGFLTSETLQTEWPKGSVRVTRTLRGTPIATAALGVTAASVRGTSFVPSLGGPPVTTLTTRSSWTPDAQFTFRNGIALHASYAILDQLTDANGNQTETNQRDVSADLAYAFHLPSSIHRGRQLVRSQATALNGRTTSCLTREEATCASVSDTRRQEYRAGLDTDLSRILSGGLQFSYTLTEARHLNRKYSQIIITASAQLSLFAGDYR